jgi:hypothetical protein
MSMTDCDTKRMLEHPEPMSGTSFEALRAADCSHFRREPLFLSG